MLKNRLFSIFILLFLIPIVSTVLAVDMKGKFGMGVGWSAGSAKFTPDYAITKFGIGEKLVLEPMLYFGFTSLSNGASTSSYEVDLNMLLAFALMAHEKTNVYAKAGINFGLVKEPKVMHFGIPMGLGLEHFVSDHFAVDLNAGMGFSYWSNSAKLLMFTLGNSYIRAGLVWYY